MLTFTQAVAAVEIARQARDEERGVERAVGKKVGDERGSSGLAMGAGNDHGFFAADKEVAQDLRQ